MPTDFATEYNGVWTPSHTLNIPDSSVRLEFADASDLGNDTSEITMIIYLVELP